MTAPFEFCNSHAHPEVYFNGSCIIEMQILALRRCCNEPISITFERLWSGAKQIEFATTGKTVQCSAVNADHV